VTDPPKTPDPAPTDDPYSRTDYRRLIAWTPRIEREGPWLLELLDAVPDRSVLDIGPGTGEHTAFFARQGARAVGVDTSASMIDKAREHEARGDGRFVHGDARRLADLLVDEPPFGLAICLGNMLPHLTEVRDLDELFAGVQRLLLRGGKLLIQALNYERILAQGVRNLPLNFREGDGDSEIVFLRLMSPAAAGRILFFPTTLLLDPSSDEPVSVTATKRVELRAWRSQDLVSQLERFGFDVLLFGDMEAGSFDPTTSTDLVVLATKTRE
jgi:glycine/sarcosine N-methyltransferase